jgi:membrane-bound serine protease (ClpP class)
MHGRLAPLILIALIALGAAGAASGAAPEPGPVAMIRLQGAIDVPSSEYLQRALRIAEEQDAQLLLILLDTPGGLGQPMQDMTKALLNAPLPTVVYVSPAGAHAMSAGTFVTLAAHVAAMHPVSTIGAAHPVSLFSMPELPGEEKKPEEPAGPPAPPGAAEPPGFAAPPGPAGPAEGPGVEEERKPEAKGSADVMTEKVVNAFAQDARVIAEARGRNAEWAEAAVRRSVAVGAKEALELGVIDLVADGVDDLLAKLDGREVTLSGGRVVTLKLAGAPVIEIRASAKERFLHVLADPNILLVLLVLAGLGIMFELQNPGAILPGVVGGLSLLLALYSMAVLPVNYAGVGLIAFAMLLFLAEVKVASHGVLTVGGVASFVTGALMLMDTELHPALTVSWQVIIVMAVLMVMFFLFVVGAAIRAHMRKVETGSQGMSKAPGRALTKLDPKGSVLVEGERWRARAAEGEIGEGEGVEVVGQEGFTLVVRRREAGNREAPKS